MSYEPFAATPPSPEMQALYEVTSQQTELAASVAIELLAKNAPLFEGSHPPSLRWLGGKHRRAAGLREV